jgi:hypothetical protein
VQEALEHPYLAAYHSPEDEPTACPVPEGLFDFDENAKDSSSEDWKGECSSKLLEAGLAYPLTRIDLRGGPATMKHM